MSHIRLAIFLVTALMMCTKAGAQSVQGQRPENLVSPSQSDSRLAESTSTQFSQRHPRYRVRKSDVIDVKFAFSPEFDQTVAVQPDGYVTLTAAGDVQVENKTPAEVAAAIRFAYRGILHEPVVTVALKDFDKPFFIAAGQIGRPGKYELRGNTTLVDALAIAGGLTEASKHSEVVLFRRVSDETVEARVFNVKHMLQSRNLQEDPYLSPGDMLFVPQNKMSKLRRYLPASSMGMYLTPNAF
jgi:polysaccharide biosynthesis/export protein